MSGQKQGSAPKRYMLEVINEERRKAGVPEVTLGDNRAAQLHAEAAWRAASHPTGAWTA